MRRVLALALLGVAGCANVLGLDDYFDAVDGAPEAGLDGDTDVRLDATADAAPDALADADAGTRDAEGGVDAGTDATTDASTCIATGPEDCSNGVDDDCNGQTDCTDPSCTTGYSCVPPLPLGWTSTAYDQGARPSCATGFTTPTDVNEGLVAPPATCGCGCTTTSPTCMTGNVTMTAGTTGANGCQDQASQLLPAAAGCQLLTPALAATGWSVNATAPAPSGGSCAATPATSKGAVSYGYQGRTCAFTGSVGAGCGGGAVCAPKAAPYTMCVAHAGDAVCPNGYLVKHLTGSLVTDTRACSACTCAFSPGTCGGALTLYSNSTCTAGAAPVTADATCRPVTNGPYTNFVYAPQSTASCAGSAVAAIGGATFADLETICCVN